MRLRESPVVRASRIRGGFARCGHTKENCHDPSAGLVFRISRGFWQDL